MLVEQLAGALEALSAAAALSRAVGRHQLAGSPLAHFFFFFGAVFLLSLPFYYYVVGVDGRKAAVLASCSMYSVHGALSALGGYQQLLAWPSFQVDLPNTPQQKLLNEFSLGYMAADMLFFLLPFTPDDHEHILHHTVSSIYLVGCLLHHHGAIGCIMMFFLATVTSPVFSVFTIAKELRHHNKAALQVFTFTSPLFTVAFISVRSVMAPPVVAWFVFTLWFRSSLIPGPWRFVMGSCVLLGMVVSQIWSHRLQRSYAKRRRHASRLAGGGVAAGEVKKADCV
ncbi:hypothetical protein CHLNCDRAFT_58129 [Chlorella variabilis]|uniref:TLC domain-containing protein n=1 Tax=Chlorella variabilis TaxID=554065 RepID=E1ZHI4_CHLVA|nr:hypothetical protein CHLNCDRAFT_58129 [Chlorella variabilis]EFN54468.1 hypothetical protein CHLNCDRAFT_58129 [Chlorella variabilis]|eukprot:XP_005846570.1 hypothetical protein CHLNCDRAFT_58129 [Chlorella variabilis]